MTLLLFKDNCTRNPHRRLHKITRGPCYYSYMEILQEKDSEVIVTEITEWLEAYARTPVLILASGGSSAKVFAAAWGRLPKEAQNNCSLSLADERYGPPGHVNSNWRLLESLGVQTDNARHLSVLQTGASLDETASHWESALLSQLARPLPVIALLGMGDDSHIAGIKPKSPSTNETPRLVAAYPWSDYDRITITPSMLSKLASARVYAAGPEKHNAINLLGQSLDPTEYPSQFLKQINDCRVYYQP